MRSTIFLLGTLWCTGLAAQTLAPEISVKPVAADLRADASAADQADQKSETAIEPTPTVLDGEPVAKGMRDQLRATDADYAACLTELDSMGVTYTEAEPVIADNDADCGILRPLSVTSLGAGVAVEPQALLRCETAKSLAIWTQEFVIPASQRLSERGPLVSIENGSGYICRRRMNLPDGKLSEHAFGNAFDVMGFGFEDGSRVAIEPREADGTMAEAFQDAVRATSCLEFSTVLGPGSDAAHADHLHLDIISRNSGYRICEQGGVEVE